jgi:heptosyltransferase-2
VAPAWVGDAVMAHALIRVLAAEHVDQALEVVAPPSTAPLFERMAEVGAVHRLDVRHGELGLRARRRLGRVLASAGFEVAYVLPNSWKSALLPVFARVRRRIGFVGELRYGLLTDARRLDVKALPRMVDRFVALARPAAAAALEDVPPPRLQRDVAAARALRGALGLEGTGPVLACAPGAEFGAAKRWPAEHFAMLAARHAARGGSVWLFGSSADTSVTARVLAAVPAPYRPAVHDLAGRTRLLEALDLLGEVDALVSNDSGLLHVACALERPVVALYGSTSPRFTPPLGARARSLSLELPCAPCFERECPFGHLRCLRDLSPDRVFAAVEAFIEARPACVS